MKPDPADAAPRRLRTETAKPVPVEEYTPSAFGRAPDKSVHVKHEHESRRREPAAKSSKREHVKPKPNATISAHVASSEDAPKAKSRGLLGFIKRIFTGDPVPAKVREVSARDNEDDSDSERHSRHGDGRSDDGAHHRHGHHRHHRGSQGRQSHDQPRGDSRGERRGDRRPE